jgi:hypothetical protein
MPPILFGILGTGKAALSIGISFGLYRWFQLVLAALARLA